MKHFLKLILFFLLIVRPVFAQTISYFEGDIKESSFSKFWSTNDNKEIYSLSETTSKTTLFKYVDGKVKVTKEYPNKRKSGKVKMKVVNTFFQLKDNIYCLVQEYSKNKIYSSSIKKVNPTNLNFEEVEISLSPNKNTVRKFPILTQLISSPNKEYFGLINGDFFIQVYDSQMKLVYEVKEASETNPKNANFIKGTNLLNSGKVILEYKSISRFRESYNFGTAPDYSLYNIRLSVYSKTSHFNIEIKNKTSLVRDYSIIENSKGDIGVVGYIGEPVYITKIKALNNLKTLDSKKLMFHLFDGRTGEEINSNEIGFTGDWEYLRTHKLLYLEDKELFAFVGVEVLEEGKTNPNENNTGSYAIKQPAYKYGNIQVLFIDNNIKIVAEIKLLHKDKTDPFSNYRGSTSGLVVTDNGSKVFIASNGSKDASWEEEDLKSKENKYSGVVFHTIYPDGSIQTLSIKKELDKDKYVNTELFYISEEGTIVLSEAYDRSSFIIFQSE
ncbi:MAG: hypothetical protein COA58_05450 [Bacteroidetes bacterium]|nr:MAG: hypothetical protein COA58_05450 [Bacteroidota bacterium]